MTRNTFLIAIAATIAISATPAGSQSPQSPAAAGAALIGDAAKAIAVANGRSLVFVTSAPDNGRSFTIVGDGSILIAPAVTDQIQSPAEALALAAVLASYIDPRANNAVAGHATGLAAIAAGVGALAIGGAIDNKNEDATALIAQSNTRVVDQSIRPVPASTPWSQILPSGPLAASRATRWLDKAGGCTGALVALFGRLSRNGGRSKLPAAIDAGSFARSVLQDMRASIYPPDSICL